jgi:hypothetical protein
MEGTKQKVVDSVARFGVAADFTRSKAPVSVSPQWSKNCPRADDERVGRAWRPSRLPSLWSMKGQWRLQMQPSE